jgi:hypothetical protein
MDSSEVRLEQAADSSERWGWGFGGLIVVAVLFELLLAAIHPPYDSVFGRWGSAMADGLIAIGVAGEILFARVGSSCQSELRRRTEESLAEAWRMAEEAQIDANSAKRAAREAMTSHEWYAHEFGYGR